MGKPKLPDILIELRDGIPHLVRNTKKCRVEIRDYEQGDALDSRLEKDANGIEFFPYRWRKGAIDR